MAKFNANDMVDEIVESYNVCAHCLQDLAECSEGRVTECPCDFATDDIHCYNYNKWTNIYGLCQKFINELESML